MSEMIDPQLLRRIKTKMKQPAKREQVKIILTGLSRADLQNRSKVKLTLRKVSEALGEPITSSQLDSFANWIVAQRINPHNKLQLLRFWSMLS
jgi:hypothetical protein